MVTALTQIKQNARSWQLSYCNQPHCVLGLWGEESGNPGPAHVNVVNQVAVVGFEMVIFSFSRVFVLENTNPDYVADILLYVNYALE